MSRSAWWDRRGGLLGWFGRTMVGASPAKTASTWALTLALAGCGESALSGTCVGGCGGNGGGELFGPAAPTDWTSFRNGALRTGVAVGGVLGSDVQVAWRRPDFMVLDYSAVKPSAVVWGDGLYVPSDEGTLWAFDRHTGDVLWSSKLSDAGKGIHGSPAVSKSVVWVGTYSGYLHAVDRLTGEEVYRYRPGRWIGSSPVYVPEHNSVYVSHETWVDGLPGAGLVTRNDPRTGEAVWTSDLIDHYPHSSVAVEPTRGRVVVGANDGRVRTYDSETGELLWSRDFEPGEEADPYTADIKTTPALSPGRNLAIVGTWDRNLYALDLTTGQTRWTVDTGGALMGSAAVHEATGRVYVGTTTGRDALLAISLDSGEVVWRLDTNSRIDSSPAVNDTGDGLVVGSSDGRVWGVDTATGQARWVFQADGPVTASPAWVGPMIYVGAKQGSLYALQTIDD